jgi:hypothetical protein
LRGGSRQPDPRTYPATQAQAVHRLIVFVSLPLFIVAGCAGQRRGPVRAMIGAMGARVIVLGVLAGRAGHAERQQRDRRIT